MDWSPFDALRSASEIELAASPSASTLRHSRNTFGILCSIPEPNPSLVEDTGRTLYSLASDILMNSFLNAQRIDVAAALQKQGLLYVSQIDDAQRLLNPSSLLMPTPAELDIEGKSAVIASLRDWIPRISNWPPTQPPFIWSKRFGCLPRLFYFAGIVQRLVLQDLDRLLHTFLTLLDVHKASSIWKTLPKVGRPLPLISTRSEPHVVCSEMDPVAPSIVPSPSILEIASHSHTGPVVAKTGLAVHLDLDNLSASVPKVASPLVSLTQLCTSVPAMTSTLSVSSVPLICNIAMLSTQLSDKPEDDPDLPESKTQSVSEQKLVAQPSVSLSLPLLSVIPPQTELRPVVQDGTQATPNVPVTHFRPPHPEATVRPASRRQTISFKPSSSSAAARSLDPAYPFLNSSFTAYDRAQRDEEEEQEAYASGLSVPRRGNENSQIIISADP